MQVYECKRAGEPRAARITLLLCALGIALLMSLVCAPSARAESGMVRVHLTRLGSITSLSFTPDCTYYVNGDRAAQVPAGAKVTVTLSSGALLYKIGGGENISAGTRLTFNRGKKGNVGIRFDKPSLGNLFCGDLQLSIASSKIKPVLNIYVENYLYGVVGYEMSDSFPLESLKAQAVAARNYAISSRKSSGTHDLTDSTSSQVFKGYNAGQKNVIRAVDETRGVCALYNGKLIECFYASSNGGQIDTTKNVWGNALGYSKMKDDPYDLDNPGSAVKKLSVPKAPTAQSPLNKELRALLIAAMKPQLQAQGLLTGASDVSIEKIKSIAAHTPKYPEPSRTFTKLKFSIEIVGVSEATGEKVVPKAPIKVDIGTYSELKDKCGLGHQKSDLEIISVAEGANAFSIEFRRWGHGVGMSQRGAQWMAKNHGKTYKEILKFYFSGIELETKSLADSTMAG